MKYSQLAGIIATFAVAGICFLPWVFIANANITITGLDAEGTSFGKPGLLNIILCAFCMILFALPKVWAKRVNVFIAAINLAWAIRNYLLLTTCQAGECPQKKIGLYLLLVAAFIIQLMTFFPKIAVEEEK
jgi:hypothetical protein